MPIDLVIAGERVVTPEGVRPAAVLIEAGRIAAVVNRDEAPAGVPGRDAAGLVVMPGLVDSHVHVNEPGRTEWEGFQTATQAAAAGGVTTIVDMPLNCIPVTTSVQALEFKLEAARGLCAVDTAFWGGVVPGNAGQLERMVEQGARGFKAFLIHSGIDDFPASTEEDLRRAMPLLAKMKVPLLVHAELAGPAEARPEAGEDFPRRYDGYLASRPASWEREAIALMIGLCREFHAPVHIVHLSDAGSLPLIAAAKAEGLPLTAETCPHYLSFCAEDIPEGRTDFKCAPPIREDANREALWQGLKGGVIDLVVSDHSPCLPGLKLMKEGDFTRAWGGISSVQFTLPAMWTQARRRGFGLADLTRWMSARPAALAGLSKSKGLIAAGLDADLVVWDTEAEYELQPQMIRHRHKISPYAGSTLRGMVAATFLRGKKIYENGAFPAKAQGELLKNG
jgi:allantoinase